MNEQNEATAMTITTPVLTEYCQVIPPAPKRRGRKKGARLEMIALEEGGAGGRRGNKRKEESSWNLLKPAEEDSDDDDSDFSTLSDISEGDDDEDWDEKEDLHVSNMTGNRILQVDKLASILKEHMCCRKCAVHNHTNHMRRFLQFTKEYEDKMKREEYDNLFTVGWIGWNRNWVGRKRQKNCMQCLVVVLKNLRRNVSVPILL